MRRREDRVGELLARAGVISAEDVALLLEAQRAPLPVASLCYVLGLADEETLARMLSRQSGTPAVVLDRSVIPLALLEGVAPELALSNQILPLCEDRRHLFVAAEDPRAVGEVLREIEFIRGKAVVAHVALRITLARTLHACRRARERGDELHYGASIDPRTAPPVAAVHIVSEQKPPPPGSPEARAHQAVVEDITKEIVLAEMLAFEVDTTIPGLTDRPLAEGTPTRKASPLAPLPPPVMQDGAQLVSARTWVKSLEQGGGALVLDLDAVAGDGYRPFRGPPGRVMVVDDDPASRSLLIKELDELGYQISSASSGDEALDSITRDPPDAAVLDLMLPEIDGYQICRAIKSSTKFRGMAVILMSAVIDSGRVTDDVVRQAGADDYFEKPLAIARLRRRLETLMVERGAEEATRDPHFDDALALYKAGDVEGAVEALRLGVDRNPDSPKHHFVLANLLHKKSLTAEAIDEYEATLELKPDYFPALTRLAYLYYKQGFSARAIDTWRRSLPLCPDQTLRHNIEVFMRKLISDLEDPST